VDLYSAPIMRWSHQ